MSMLDDAGGILIPETPQSNATTQVQERFKFATV
jgi:hypothetical protein